MRALTLWQPWGTAIIHGPKDVENRSWGPPRNLVGRWLVIHAGKRFQEDAPLQIRALWPELPPRAAIPLGALLGVAHLTGVIPAPRSSSPWASDEGLCWVFGECVPLLAPIPCRGGRMLWDVPAEFHPAIRQAVTRCRTCRKRKGWCTCLP